MADRNRVHHGHFHSEETGEFSLLTEEWRLYGDESLASLRRRAEDQGYVTPEEDEDLTEEWRPEITLVLTRMEQLEMVRVLGPDGNTYRLRLD